MLNKQIETGPLISEILKSNFDQKYAQNFAKYLIGKIMNEGYFISSLFQQLIKLAEISSSEVEEVDDIFIVNAHNDKETETRVI